MILVKLKPTNSSRILYASLTWSNATPQSSRLTERPYGNKNSVNYKDAINKSGNTRQKNPIDVNQLTLLKLAFKECQLEKHFDIASSNNS